jgi:hypothetical protein
MLTTVLGEKSWTAVTNRRGKNKKNSNTSRITNNNNNNKKVLAGDGTTFEEKNSSSSKGRNTRTEVEINDTIIIFGRNHQWQAILSLYEERKEDF